VLRAGLDVGIELDRERARRLRRELKRHETMQRAARALRSRDLSSAELDARLERANVPTAARAEVIERLTAAGAVDDERFAISRAAVLAGRGAGDFLVRHDLEARGLEAEAIEAAVASLELEPVRAARICSRRGPGPKTARFLARKGFSQETIESACAEAVAEHDPSVVR
jgi:SOS response regulatory protein OraA/RecX